MGAVPTRTAVVVPGRRYSADAPLLAYAATAARARHAQVRTITWTVPADLLPDVAEPWMNARVEPVLDALVAEFPGTTPLLIGKSLGTRATALAADRQLPAVWFTPLLNVEPVVAALRRATAPSLLIGGTADESWDGAVACQLTPYVLEVPDANHGMHVPGPLANSAAVLGRVVAAVEEFLDQVVWPG